MGITYSAQSGSTITSFVMNETLGSQADQTGSNTVIVSDDIVTLENGQIGSGANGIGGSYVGRLIIINLGTGTQQIRRCTTEAATGTGTTYRLTVHEDWDTVPASSDTIHVCYEYADIEDGGASGGIALGSKTGLWELSNTLNIGNGTDPAGLQGLAGQALECDDDGNNISFYILNNGYYFLGYESNSTPINGGIITGYNNVQGEPWIQFASGGTGYLYDSVLWCQLFPQQLEIANGADVTLWNTKIISGTDELHLYDTNIVNCTIGGRASTTEIVRVDSGTTCNGLILSNVDTLDTVADTTTETIELEGVTFADVTDLINVRNNKTWNLIDPIWDATTYTDFTWVGSTSNVVNDRRSIKATVQTAAGTSISGALIAVYEQSQDNLIIESYTDATGYAEDSFIYKAHATNSTTTTYNGHALRVDKWLYTPFVTSQSSSSNFNGTVTLLVDSNINETNQTTALSNGSGITWKPGLLPLPEDANPSCIIKYTGGTGSLLVGMVITGGSSGADGVVTEIIDGDSTAGTVHLNKRDTNNFSAGESVSRTGGTAGTWSATYTVATQQDFSITVDCNSKSLQVVYDYLAALTSENTLSATGELIHGWGRASEGRALSLGGSGFYTNRSNSKGVILIDVGAGSIAYYTDDAGGTFTPYVGIQLTISANVTLVGAEVRIYDYEGGPPDFGTELDGAESHGSSTFVFESTASNLIYIQILKSGYEEFGQQYTMPSSSGDFYANLKVDTNM